LYEHPRFAANVRRITIRTSYLQTPDKKTSFAYFPDILPKVSMGPKKRRARKEGLAIPDPEVVAIESDEGRRKVERELARALSKCANLQSFTWEAGILPWDCDEIWDALRRCCPKLSELNITDTTQSLKGSAYSTAQAHLDRIENSKVRLRVRRGLSFRLHVLSAVVYHRKLEAVLVPYAWHALQRPDDSGRSQNYSHVAVESES
jgi:hypothetical protein